MKVTRILAGKYKIVTSEGEFIAEKRNSDFGTAWHHFATGDHGATSDSNWVDAFSTLGDCKDWANGHRWD